MLRCSHFTLNVLVRPPQDAFDHCIQSIGLCLIYYPRHLSSSLILYSEKLGEHFWRKARQTVVRPGSPGAAAKDSSRPLKPVCDPRTNLHNVSAQSSVGARRLTLSWLDGSARAPRTGRSALASNRPATTD